MNCIDINEVHDALKEHGVFVTSVEVRKPCDIISKITIEGLLYENGKRDIDRKHEPIMPEHIFKNGLYTTVMWSDGTKTIVKRGEDEPDDEYTAFTAALAKKLYGSTSAVKRIAEMTKVQSKKYKESSDCAEKDACEIAVENHGCNEDKGETLNDLVRKQWEDYLKGEKG